MDDLKSSRRNMCGTLMYVLTKYVCGACDLNSSIKICFM